MMVNCPKCGFSQPQDQYCAKCGVDMVAFRAKTKANTSLFSKPAAQVSALAIVVVSGGLFLHNASTRAKAKHDLIEAQNAESMDAQASQLSTAQSEMKSARAEMNETQSASVAPPDSTLATAPQAPPPTAPNPSAEFVQSAAVATGTTSPAGPPPAAGIKAAMAPAQKVRVYFIEGQAAFLQDLLNRSQQGGSDGTVSWGVLADLDQRLKSSSAWHSLEQGQDKQIKLNQRIVSFGGSRDAASGQSIGLNVQVIPLAQDEVGTRLQIDGNHVLPEETLNFKMPESFVVPKGGSIILTGVLPHRAPNEQEQALFRSSNVLKTMTGTQWPSSATDVAIVIDAR